MFAPYVAGGQYWRLLTAIFLHVGFVHLAFNSIGLLVFGGVVERLYGRVRFFWIYILAGIAGSVTSYVLNPITVGAGASGAIFGVMGAFAAFFLASRHVLGETARQTLSGIGILLAVNLFFGFATPEIDNWAHIGGLFTGFVIGLAFAPRYYFSSLETSYDKAQKFVSFLLNVKRWVLVLSVLVFMVAGTILGNLILPDNSVSRLHRAETLIHQGKCSEAAIELRSARDLAVYENSTEVLIKVLQLMARGC
jgi:rhomboid protease GluP